MKSNCIIYGLTSESYLPLLIESIKSIQGRGRFSGQFLINTQKDLVLTAMDALAKYPVVINPVFLDRGYNELFYAKYHVGSVTASNFLYLDADIMAIGDISPIFAIIQKNSTTVSCVEEFSVIPEWANHYHWKDQNGNITSYNKSGLNGGTFGFTRNRLDILDIIKLARHGDFLAGSDTDQPILNKILHETGVFNTELTPFVHLMSREEESKRDTNVLRHFNGPKARICDYKEKLKFMVDYS